MPYQLVRCRTCQLTMDMYIYLYIQVSTYIHVYGACFRNIYKTIFGLRKSRVESEAYHTIFFLRSTRQPSSQPASQTVKSVKLFKFSGAKSGERRFMSVCRSEDSRQKKSNTSEWNNEGSKAIAEESPSEGSCRCLGEWESVCV